MDRYAQAKADIVTISDTPDMDLFGPLIEKVLGLVVVPEGHEALAPECNVHEPCWGRARYVSGEQAYCERGALFALGRELIVLSTVSEANYSPKVEAEAFWETVESPLLNS